MMLSLRETAQALSGSVIGDEGLRFARVTTDSRDIRPGDLFVALKGERFDAHDFVAAAQAQGAVAALVEREVQHAGPQVIVGNTLDALGLLAKYWRGLHADTRIVGVTGSNGKTSVKEMCSAIFAQLAGHDGVHATRGNLNNHIGLPLTLLGLRNTHRVVVAEMGMNHFGEIDYLTRIARPDVAVINNAGAAHLEALGSVEGVARAKGEIFNGLAEQGTAIINSDDPFAPLWSQLAAGHRQITFGLNAADVSARQIVQSATSSRFIIDLPHDDAEIILPVPGLHNVRNALAAAACAYALDVGINDIAAGLNAYRGVAGRLQAKQAFNGAQLLDDSYNANPDSMKAAVDVLAGIGGHTILVLGDMGEVGDDAPQRHSEIGGYAREKGVSELFTLGEHMAGAARAFGSRHFADIAELLAAVRAAIRPESTVLVKGSRFMKMERVVAGLEQTARLEGEK